MSCLSFNQAKTFILKRGIQGLLLGLFLAFSACSPGVPGEDSMTFMEDPLAYSGDPVPCLVCHDEAQSDRRAIFGSSGDFGQNFTRATHHIAGFSDPTEAQCQVCHEVTEHMAGTIRLRHADTDEVIVFDSAAPEILEPFCLSCHDADGATATALDTESPLSPFGDGETLGTGGFPGGNLIAEAWAKTGSTHRTSGLTCASCHGNAGEARGHSSTQKAMLTAPLSLPVPSFTTDPLASAYENYQLCFDCHDDYPRVTKEVVLGYPQGSPWDVFWAQTPYYTTEIKSGFRDRRITVLADYPVYWSGVSPIYNDNFWGDKYTPLHNYHLGLGDGWMNGAYRYRDGTTGRASCPMCHNVHGTTNTPALTHEVMGLIPGTGGPNNEDIFLEFTGWADANLKFYPVNCAVSCHSMVGKSYAWRGPP